MSSGYTPIPGVDYDVTPPEPQPPPSLGSLAFPEIDSNPLFRSIVFINTVFRNDATGQFQEYRGSGVLVGRNDILTAAHVVSTPGSTLVGINIFPGYDEGMSVKGFQQIERFVGYEWVSGVPVTIGAWNE